MKLKIFCRCSLFPSWSGYGLISTPVRYSHDSVFVYIYIYIYIYIYTYTKTYICIYIYIHTKTEWWEYIYIYIYIYTCIHKTYYSYGNVFRWNVKVVSTDRQFSVCYISYSKLSETRKLFINAMWKMPLGRSK